VQDSLIYVEPIYLRAEQSELPEMKRVIVGYQDNIEIGLDLQDALDKVFGRREEKIAAAEKTVVRDEAAAELSIMDIQGLAEKANNYFNEAQERLRAGDFAGYGEYIERLQSVLNQLTETAQ
jgi:uncharacterized membrane protein (UPF0182 family)